MPRIKKIGSKLLTISVVFGAQGVHAFDKPLYGTSYNPNANIEAAKSVPVQGTMEEKIQQIEERLGLAQTLDKKKTFMNNDGKVVWEFSNVVVADQGYRFGAAGYSGSYGMKCFNDKGVPGYNPNKLMQCGGLMGVNLSDIDLSGGIDLRGASLSSATMRCTNIQGGQLQGATIHGADLSGLNRDCSSPEAFKNTKVIAPTHFEGARLNKSFLNQSNLNRSILTGVEAIGTSFKDASMLAAHMSGDFTDAKFNNADLRYALMADMDVRGADFSGADLRGSIISNLTIDDTTIFTGAKFDIDKPENLPFSICYAVMSGMLPYENGKPVNLFIEDFFENNLAVSHDLDLSTPNCKWDRVGEKQVITDNQGISLVDSEARDEGKKGKESSRKVWFTNLFGDSNKIKGVVREE